jgi:5-methylcytosine-specific restriction endonuclease McrA
MWKKNPFCWFCGVLLPMPSGTGPVGEDFATLEHLIPLSKGGNYSRANLVLAHLSCNKRAGTELFCQKWKLRQELRER